MPTTGVRRSGRNPCKKDAGVEYTCQHGSKLLYMHCTLKPALIDRLPLSARNWYLESRHRAGRLPDTATLGLSGNFSDSSKLHPRLSRPSSLAAAMRPSATGIRIRGRFFSRWPSRADVPTCRPTKLTLWSPSNAPIPVDLAARHAGPTASRE